MGIPEIKSDHFTYADYLTWNDDQRWELIQGNAFAMTPAPGTFHQTVLVNLVTVFGNYLKGKSCRVFAAPFDVRLGPKNAANDEIGTVVQPDISVFCDRSKIDERGALGSPDLIIEILSPSTSKMDFGIKLLLYQEYGVKEYWIADVSERTINVYKLKPNGKYTLDKIYQNGDSIQVGLFPDLMVDLKDVFEK